MESLRSLIFGTPNKDDEIKTAEEGSPVVDLQSVHNRYYQSGAFSDDESLDGDDDETSSSDGESSSDKHNKDESSSKAVPGTGEPLNKNNDSSTTNAILQQEDEEEQEPLTGIARRLDAFYVHDNSTAAAVNYVPTRLLAPHLRKSSAAGGGTTEKSSQGQTDGSAAAASVSEDNIHAMGDTEQSATDGAQQKKRKLALVQEWTKVRTRWQRRKYDYRTEPDVGGVIARVAKRHVVGARQQQGKSSETTSALGAVNEKTGLPMIDSQQPTLDLRPYEERLDFRTLGYAAPRDAELDFDYDAYLRQQRVHMKIEPDKTASLSRPRDDSDNENSCWGAESMSGGCPVLRDTVAKKRRRVRPRAGALQCKLVSQEPNPRQNSELFYQELYASSVARQILASGGEGLDTIISDLNDLGRVKSTKEYRHYLLHNAMGNAICEFLRQEKWVNRKAVWQQCMPQMDLAMYDGTDARSMLQYYYSLQRRFSIRDDIAGSRQRGPKFSKNRSVKSLQWLQRDINFVFVPGAQPPVPRLPLDVTRIAYFSVADKNASVAHEDRSAKSTFAFRWIVASLVARFAMTDDCLLDDDDEDELSDRVDSTPNSNVSHQKVARQRVVYDLQRFIAELLRLLSASKRHLALQARLRREAFRELPLAGLYRAVMVGFSLVANHCIPNVSRPTSQIIDDKDDDDDDDDDDNQRGSVSDETVSAFASIVRHNGLEYFPRVHLSFGLLCIAQVLPSSAFKILAMPPDDDSQTPIDTFRLLMENLEMNELLTTAVPEYKEDGVAAARLEYCFFEAEQCFLKCVEREPNNPKYISWYIGCQLASLVLCSGNRIGSGAHLYPSYYTAIDESQRMFLSLSKQAVSSAPHEVRAMLPKFHEHKMKIVGTLKLLRKLMLHQPSLSTTSAFTSVLEWNEAIALIVGQQQGDCEDTLERIFSSIRFTHQRLSEEGILQGGVPRPLSRLKKKETPTAMEIAMKALECDPSDTSRWRKVVRLIGPIGYEFPSVVQARCRDCTDCRYLRHGRSLDHGKQRFIQKHTVNWELEILWSSSEDLGSLAHLKDNVKKIKKRIMERGHRSRKQESHECYEKKPDITSVFDWLDSLTRGAETTTTPTVEDRERVYDNYLPNSTGETLNEALEDDDFEAESSDDDAPKKTFSQQKKRTEEDPWSRLHGVDSVSEMRAYSIYLLCHILGPSHKLVRNSVLTLIKDSIITREITGPAAPDGTKEVKIKYWIVAKSCSFKALEWLAEAGLAIDKILNDHIAAEEGAFGTDQQRSDIDDCIKHHGFLDGKYASKNYESLKSLGGAKTRGLYDVLVVAGRKPANSYWTIWKDKQQAEIEEQKKKQQRRNIVNPKVKYTDVLEDGTIRPKKPVQISDYWEGYALPNTMAKVGYEWSHQFGFWVDKRGAWDPVLKKTVYKPEEITIAHARADNSPCPYPPTPDPAEKKRPFHTPLQADGTYRPTVRLQILDEGLRGYSCPWSLRTVGYAWNRQFGFWVDKRGAWDPVLEKTVYLPEEIATANKRAQQCPNPFPIYNLKRKVVRRKSASTDAAKNNKRPRTTAPPTNVPTQPQSMPPEQSGATSIPEKNASNEPEMQVYAV